MIVGTAGHIDHGKTALVKALTGVDADRLKEEKERGITIDLGFAYLPLPEGRSIGFVDVPGHERLVHTMLAGAGGIDLALLVIAADDGVMPQTREHLAILDLLGIPRAVVVLSKVDLADADRRAAAESEIRASLAPTRFRDAPILPVSVVTGEGVATLRATLEGAERETQTPSPTGRFRLGVDRSFTLTGVGTIVTGTVVSGIVAVGDRVVISPSGLAARVRGLHAQNRPAERGFRGQRCALNLAGEGVTKEAVGRGDVVLDPALHAPTDRIDARLHVLSSEPKAIGTWFPARLHVGSTEAGVRVVALGDAIQPGGEGFVQLVLDRSIAATCGNRFVLRDVSARRTIGGGRLLDLRAPARKRRTPERRAVVDALGDADPAGAVTRLLDTPPYVVDFAGFLRDHAIGDAGSASLLSQVDAVPLATETGTLLMARSRWTELQRTVEDTLARVHADSPDLQGLGRERLRLTLEPRMAPHHFAATLRGLIAAGTVAIDGGFVRLPGHTAKLSEADERLWGAVALRLGGDMRFRPPRVRDLAQDLGADEREVRRAMAAYARLGRLDHIAPDHFFLRDTTAEMVEAARESADGTPDGWFSAAQFRDRLDNGRKVAIQILDFFDRHGITSRRGDLRRMNAHRIDLFGER